MAFPDTENRKAPRVNCRFTVQYGPADGQEQKDISQLKNLSLRGVLLTTSSPFDKGQGLVLRICLPNSPEPFMPQCKVIESHQLVSGLIYDTRVEFPELSAVDTAKISSLVNLYLRK